MALLSRVVALDVPHHVTQRGNSRRFILETDADRLVYGKLLQKYISLHDLSLLGYCLMTNHVHLIVVPHKTDSLALAMKHTHGRYAAYFNARCPSSGHVWQGRYYSCPLGPKHLWAALRYTELNPVRAGIVDTPEKYAWSSAAAHCGSEANQSCGLAWDEWHENWTPQPWSAYLKHDADEAEIEDETAAIRRSRYTGRPLGDAEFIAQMEQTLRRRLRPRRGGRPPKTLPDSRQQSLTF